MKKAFLLVMICGMLAGLTGCKVQMPAKAVDGASWNEDWVTFGGVLGVEEPGHGLTLRDDKAEQICIYHFLHSFCIPPPIITAFPLYLSPVTAS